MKYFLFALTLFASSFSTDILAQGCSDAGFCTMGAMRPDQHYSKHNRLNVRSASLTSYYGMTDFADNIYSLTGEFNFSVGKFSFQTKLPYQVVNGPLANTKGISDLSLSATAPIKKTDTWLLQATLGAKIPTNKANFVSQDGRPLPMYYQTSLGTYDLVGGLSALNKNWLFAAGIQHVLFDNNQNDFFWGAWKSSPLTETANLYPVSKGIRRGTDIMFRAEYNQRFTRFNVSCGILSIGRLTQDVIVAPATLEDREVNGSEGWAFNFLMTAGYRLNAHNGLKMVFGHKIFDQYSRTTNPDGLSRKIVTTLTYEINF